MSYMLACTISMINCPQAFDNNEMSNADVTIQELGAVKKLSIINSETGTICIPAISNLLPDLKSSLETLSIQGNFMGLEDTQTIIERIISNNTVLIKLELVQSNNSLGWTLSWFTIINAARSSLLQKLSLKGRHISIDIARTICDLMKQSYLIELSFTQCSFQKGTIVLIMTAINSSAVVTLILESSSFDEEDIIAIAGCISISKLTKLSLFGAKTKDSAYLEICMSMIADAVRRSSLETLDGRNSSFFGNAESIIDIIKFSSVTKFNFTHTKFSSAESIAIIDAIKGRSDFRIIPMSDTRFTNEILIKVCDLIKSSHVHAYILDLSNCGLNEAQSAAVIASMKGSHITYLNFRSNYINREVRYAICDMLENCIIKKIEFIGLANTSINLMLPSIEKSALIKFKMSCWEGAGEDARIKIREILNVHRTILNRGYKTKSARLQGNF